MRTAEILEKGSIHYLDYTPLTHKSAFPYFGRLDLVDTERKYRVDVMFLQLVYRHTCMAIWYINSITFPDIIDYFCKHKDFLKFMPVTPILRKPSSDNYVSLEFTDFSPQLNPLTWLFAYVQGLSLNPIQQPNFQFPLDFNHLQSLMTDSSVLETFAWLMEIPTTLLDDFRTGGKEIFISVDTNSDSIYYRYQKDTYVIYLPQLVFFLLISKDPITLLSVIRRNRAIAGKLMRLISFPKKYLCYLYS